MSSNDDGFDCDLSIADLRTFLSVVQLGSQQAAAKALGVAQSTVSRRLERVEAHFRAPLFEEGPIRPPELSSAGAQVAKRVRDALDLLAPLPGVRAEPQELCIAFSGSVRAILVEALKLTKPAFACRLRETTGAEFRQLFARGAIDAALSFDLSTDRAEHSDVLKLFVGAQPLALVLPAERAHLQTQPVKTWVAGLRRSYISRSLLPKYNDEITVWLAAHGIPDHEGSESEVRTAAELFAWVEQGSHFGFLPRLCASVAGKEVVFLEAEGITYRSRLHLYVRQSVKSQLEPLFESLKQVCSSYAPG
jgi:DNA-binding transcriptional LysR family regulator